MELIVIVNDGVFCTKKLDYGGLYRCRDMTGLCCAAAAPFIESAYLYYLYEKYLQILLPIWLPGNGVYA